MVIDALGGGAVTLVGVFSATVYSKEYTTVVIEEVNKVYRVC